MENSQPDGIVGKVPAYLALDLDGVLHHTFAAPMKSHCADFAAGNMSRAELISLSEQNADEEPTIFKCASMLADVLRSSPSLRIVIASAWRNNMSVEALRTVLPAEIAARVVGVLEKHPEENDCGRIPGIRGHLMERWISRNAHGALWIALDDVKTFWSQHLCLLVECRSSSLDAETCDRLGVALRTGTGLNALTGL